MRFFRLCLTARCARPSTWRSRLRSGLPHLEKLPTPGEHRGEVPRGGVRQLAHCAEVARRRGRARGRRSGRSSAELPGRLREVAHLPRIHHDDGQRRRREGLATAAPGPRSRRWPRARSTPARPPASRRRAKATPASCVRRRRMAPAPRSQRPPPARLSPRRPRRPYAPPFGSTPAMRVTRTARSCGNPGSASGRPPQLFGLRATSGGDTARAFHSVCDTQGKWS